MDGDALKPLAELCEADPRQAAFARLDRGAAEVRPKTIEDHYSDVLLTALPARVPEDVRTHFDIARNLLLYSWFVWRFLWAAQLYAYASLELALRTRAIRDGAIGRKSRANLDKLLRIALERRWIDVERLSEYIELDRNQKQALERWLRVYPEGDLALNWAPQVDPAKYTAMLAKAIPSSRNELAHGTTALWGNPFGTVVRCRDLISHVFDDLPSQPAQIADA
jgi:hypothetical protein